MSSPQAARGHLQVDDPTGVSASVPYDHPSDKIWSIYSNRAERRDTAEMQQWGQDMDGILIFAGLFSAVVAGFSLEASRALKPDTVAVLEKISQQIAALSNDSQTTTPFSVDTPFHVPRSIMAATFLWYLSLWFSVSTALLATLVKSWIRKYLQTIEHDCTPRERARMRTYLYQGTRIFMMPYIVAFFIPSLIHTSLVLFFVGLVAFLDLINKSIAFTMLGFAAFGFISYSVFSLLPLFCSNCPYESPVTRAWYWTWLLFKDLLLPRTSSEPRNLLSWQRDDPFLRRVKKDAMRASGGRDSYALKWTLDNLSKGNELVPFIEGIPAFLQSRRDKNDTDPDALLRHNLLILYHIVTLLNTSRTWRMWEKEQCASACFAAIWSVLANLPYSNPPCPPVPLLKPPNMYPPSSRLSTLSDLVEVVKTFAKDKTAPTLAKHARCTIAAMLCYAVRQKDGSSNPWQLHGNEQEELKWILDQCKEASEETVSLWTGLSARATNLTLSVLLVFNSQPTWQSLQGPSPALIAEVCTLALIDFMIALLDCPFIPIEAINASTSILPSPVSTTSLNPKIQQKLMAVVERGMGVGADGQMDLKLPRTIINRILFGNLVTLLDDPQANRKANELRNVSQRVTETSIPLHGVPVRQAHDQPRRGLGGEDLAEGSSSMIANVSSPVEFAYEVTPY